MSYKRPFRPRLPKLEGEPVPDWQVLLMLIVFVVIMIVAMAK